MTATAMSQTLVSVIPPSDSTAIVTERSSVSRAHQIGKSKKNYSSGLPKKIKMRIVLISDPYDPLDANMPIEMDHSSRHLEGGSHLQRKQ